MSEYFGNSLELSDEEREELSGRWAMEDSLASRRAADQLAEVICPDHQYSGRLGQVMGYTRDQFVGNQPPYKVGLRNPEQMVLKRAITVNFRDEIIPIPEGCYKVLEKERLSEEEIEVVDSDGMVGKLLGWRRRLGKGGAMGVYIAQFGSQKRTKEDWSMMQEPTWQFIRKTPQEDAN